MGKPHWFIAFGFFVLLVVAFIFFPIKGSTEKKKEDNSTRSSFNEDDWAESRLESLQKDTSLLIRELWNKSKSESDKLSKADQLIQSSKLSDLSGAYDLGTFFLVKLANSTGHSTDLFKAGDRAYLTSILMDPADSTRNYFVNQAISLLKKASDSEPKNDTIRIRLAQTYMDGTENVMNGVQILLDIVAKNSNQAEALFTLGRFGIISGQFEKAINRLNKVVYLQPQNADAYILLAEAYEKNGEAKKAVKHLEKGISLLDDPEIIKILSDHLQELKQGKLP